MCMEQSTGTVVYGEVEFLMMLLNLGVIHGRPVCGSL
jgi:hypothetical protein